VVKAVVLINVQAEQTGSVAELLAAISGVVEVYSVAGNYDLVSVLSVQDNETLADVVTSKIRKVPGITRTETLIAFRSYSRRDLEGVLPMD
jgi:DNA-binding Lrp family transcriptional regulator